MKLVKLSPPQYTSIPKMSRYYYRYDWIDESVVKSASNYQNVWDIGSQYEIFISPDLFFSLFSALEAIIYQNNEVDMTYDPS